MTRLLLLGDVASWNLEPPDARRYMKSRTMSAERICWQFAQLFGLWTCLSLAGEVNRRKAKTCLSSHRIEFFAPARLLQFIARKSSLESTAEKSERLPWWTPLFAWWFRNESGAAECKSLPVKTDRAGELLSTIFALFQRFSFIPLCWRQVVKIAPTSKSVQMPFKATLQETTLATFSILGVKYYFTPSIEK